MYLNVSVLNTLNIFTDLKGPKLKYSVYNDLRIMHLPEKFYKNPNVHKFNILMSTHSCDIIQSLAKYIYYALQRRSTILNQDS